MGVLFLPNTQHKKLRPQRGRTTKRNQVSSRSGELSFADNGPSFGARTFGRFDVAAPIPLRWRVQMPFSLTSTITANAAANTFGGAIQFYVNSLYPYVADVTKVPYAAATMASLYSTYRVFGATVDIMFFDPGADGMLVAAHVEPTSVSSTIVGLTTHLADQQPQTEMRVVNNTGQQLTRIRRHFNIWEIDGLTRGQWLANSTYASPVGTTPVSAPIVQLACAAVNAGGPAVNVVTRILLDVEYYGRANQ